MKRSKLSIRSSSNPISIPGATSLRTPDIRINAENDDDEDDEVFVSNDKENVHKRKRFDTSKLKPALQVDHLFPSYSDEKGICVNSPGRRELQKVKNLSSLNIKVIGRGSFGSVVLGSWRGKTFLIHQADLQLQPMVITIFSQRVGQKYFKQNFNTSVVGDVLLNRRTLNRIIIQCDMITELHKRGAGFFDRKRVAVKVIKSKKTDLAEKNFRCDSVANELNVKDLEHKNVVRVFGVYPDSEMNSVIIMEYVGKCNLQIILDNYASKVDQAFTQRCFLHIASALEHIHEQGIIHLDVKPSNVFVSSDGNCKLGDFGCSMQTHNLEQAKRKSAESSTILVGTSGYQAPEYLQNKRPTEKCDVYAFGILMWQVIYREKPFKDLHPHVIIFQVVKKQKRPHCETRNRLNDSAADLQYKRLYQECWSQDPNERPSMKEVYEKLQYIEGKRRKSSLRV